MLFQIYKFSQGSLAELARNSVIQSGFEMEIKRHWLGDRWYLPGVAGNDMNKVCSFSFVCINATRKKQKEELTFSTRFSFLVCELLLRNTSN